MATVLQTREQQYASSAYAFVEKLFTEEVNKNPEVKQDPKKSSRLKRYGSMAHKLPILIRTAGLAQALAFVEARDKESGEHRLLMDHVACTIYELSLTRYQKDHAKQRLIKESRSTSLLEYMSITQKVLDALLWYKRFAQSVLNVDAGDSDNDKSN